MRLKKWLFLYSVWFVFFTVVSAKPITFLEAQQLSLKNNPDAQAAYVALKQADWAIQNVSGKYLPQLSASARVGRSFLDSVNSVSAGLSLSQTLYPGLWFTPEIARSVANYGIQEQVYRQSLAALRLELATAYTDWMLSKRRVELTQTISARREQNAELVGGRFSIGRENKGTFLRAQAQALQAKTEWTQAQRAHQLATDNLSRLLGETVEDVEPIEASSLSIDLAQWIQSPDYQQALLTTQVQLASLQVAQQTGGPSLQLGLSFDQSGPNFNALSSSFSGNVALNVPLFDGFKAHAAVQSAQLAVDQAKRNEVWVQKTVQYTLKSLLIDQQNAFEDKQVQEAFVEAALLRSEIAKKSYTAGIITFENWDIIENDWISQQQQLLNKEKEALLAKFKLEAFLGKGLQDE